MPRRAPAPVVDARPALQPISENQHGAAIQDVNNAKRGKSALLNDLKVKEEENLALKSKASELESQLQALTEKLQTVEISAKKQETKKPQQTDVVATVPMPPHPSISAPRRPTTAYMHYCNDNRDKVREANPEATNTDHMRILGAQWKALAPLGPEMMRYNKIAEQDKARYDADMKAFKQKTAAYEEECKAIEYYNAQLKTKAALDLYEDVLSKQAPENSAQKHASEAAPKKPLSAFMLFQSEKRRELKANNPDADTATISRLVGEEWSKVQKRKNGARKWITAADKDKGRYEREYAEYEQRVADTKAVEQERQRAQYDELRQKALNAYRHKVEGDAAVTEYKKHKAADLQRQKEERLKVREEKQTKKEEKERMPKRPMTAFFFYSKDAREDVKQRLAQTNGVQPSVTEVSVELGKLWADLAQNKRDYYNRLATTDKARYESEMATYNASRS